LSKYKKQFKIAIPRVAFEKLEKVLQNNPPNFKFETEGFYGIIRDISSKMFDSEDGMVPLSSTILQRKYGERYRLMLDYLVLSNLIKENHQFLENKCRSFTLVSNSKRSRKETTNVEINLDTQFGKYVKKRHNEEQRKAKTQLIYIRTLRKEFYDMNFDFQSAVDDLNSKRDLITEEQYFAIYDDLLCLSKGNSVRRYFSRNTTNNRIDTNITALKSYFKRYIISDQILYSFDLKNSQPVIFNVILNLINKEIMKDDLTHALFYGNTHLKELVTQCSKGFEKDQKLVIQLQQEIENYKKYTGNGTWYNHLADIYNEYYRTDYFDRDKAKTMWMALAYSSNRSVRYNPMKVAFEKKYPQITSILKTFKRKNYKNLAIVLQQIESNIFIDQLAVRLIENGIVPLTIHDSIIIRENDLTNAQEIMNQVLQDNIGFVPVIQKDKLVDSEFKSKSHAIDIAEKIGELDIRRRVLVVKTKKKLV
jgi:hypothetical protein